MTRILFAEDERTLGGIVTDSLESQGFEVVYCPDGKTAWEAYEAQGPDLCLLDVMLPWTDGFSLAEKIRETDTDTPILFLTAKSQTKDVIEGFKAGADDYLKKPFSIEELIARIRAILKRQAIGLDEEPIDEQDTSAISLGSYTFNYQRQTLDHAKGFQKLTSREAGLLLLLYQNRQQVLEQQVVLHELWENDSIFSTRSMQVYITKLRRHLRHDPKVMILNVRGVGYKLVL